MQASIIRPEQALPIKPFGLDLKVLLTTEATGGAISVLMGWHKPGEGAPDHVPFNQEEMFFMAATLPSNSDASCVPRIIVCC